MHTTHRDRRPARVGAVYCNPTRPRREQRGWRGTSHPPAVPIVPTRSQATRPPTAQPQPGRNNQIGEEEERHNAPRTGTNCCWRDDATRRVAARLYVLVGICQVYTASESPAREAYARPRPPLLASGTWRASRSCPAPDIEGGAGVTGSPHLPGRASVRSVPFAVAVLPCRHPDCPPTPAKSARQATARWRVAAKYVRDMLTGRMTGTHMQPLRHRSDSGKSMQEKQETETETRGGGFAISKNICQAVALTLHATSVSAPRRLGTRGRTVLLLRLLRDRSYTAGMLRNAYAYSWATSILGRQGHTCAAWDETAPPTLYVPRRDQLRGSHRTPRSSQRSRSRVVDAICEAGDPGEQCTRAGSGWLLCC